MQAHMKVDLISLPFQVQRLAMP